MAEARIKLPKYTSPKTTFRFPKLAEPDYGNEKYAKPDGEYSVQMLFQADSPEAKALIKQLTPHYQEARAFAAEGFSNLSVKVRKSNEKEGITGPKMNELYSIVYDKETEEPTGEIVFKAAMKASGVRKKGPKTGQKWERKPVIFDARGTRMVKVPEIWGGTVGKVAFEVSPYYIEGTNVGGLKLSLTGVQVLDLVSAGGASRFRPACRYGRARPARRRQHRNLGDPRARGCRDRTVHRRHTPPWRNRG